jgi:hypothetical protein
LQFLEQATLSSGGRAARIAFLGGAHMSDSADPAGTTPQERIPFMQRLLDNPFLLLFIGVTVPTVLYIVWGIMELVQVPVAPR